MNNMTRTLSSSHSSVTSVAARVRREEAGRPGGSARLVAGTVRDYGQRELRGRNHRPE